MSDRKRPAEFTIKPVWWAAAFATSLGMWYILYQGVIAVIEVLP